MNSRTGFSIAVYVVRLFLGTLFLYVSIDKIINPAKFAEIIYNYRILPVGMLNLVALIIPWLEAVLGITLIFGIWLETSALLLSGIIIVFIVLLISAISRGLDIQCGCFSLDADGGRVSWMRVIEDVLMLAGTLFIWFQALFKKKIS